MTKKHFIALGIEVKGMLASGMISDSGVQRLALFCRDTNPAFNRDRWLGFVYGTNGPSGGVIKKEKAVRCA